MAESAANTVHILDWLGVDALPQGATIRELLDLVKASAQKRWMNQTIGCSLAKRWPGHDPKPDVDPDFGIVEVYRWLKIVEKVAQPTLEIGLDQIPATVRSRRSIGDSWHETLAYVLLPGANMEAREPGDRGLGTLPTTSTRS